MSQNDVISSLMFVYWSNAFSNYSYTVSNYQLIVHIFNFYFILLCSKIWRCSKTLIYPIFITAILQLGFPPELHIRVGIDRIWTRQLKKNKDPTPEKIWIRQKLFFKLNLLKDSPLDQALRDISVNSYFWLCFIILKNFSQIFSILKVYKWDKIAPLLPMNHFNTWHTHDRGKNIHSIFYKIRVFWSGPNRYLKKIKSIAAFQKGQIWIRS